MDRQTHVKKTLPCPKLRLRAVNIKCLGYSDSFYWIIQYKYTVTRINLYKVSCFCLQGAHALVEQSLPRVVPRISGSVIAQETNRPVVIAQETVRPEASSGDTVAPQVSYYLLTFQFNKEAISAQNTQEKSTREK